jgi:RNA polymerase sigma factor (sigma-70 family)
MNEPIKLTKGQRDLVEKNKALVYFVAKRWRGIREEDYIDLCGRLFVRLCNSVAAWKPEMGYKLSSYVVQCLKGEAKNFFRDDIWIVRPPRRLREHSLSELLDAVKDSPSQAAVQGESPEKIRSCAMPLSIGESLVDPGTDAAIADVLVADTNVEEEVLARVGGDALLKEIFDALRPEEGHILDLLMRAAEENFSPLQEVQDTYQISRTEAQEVIEELQEKVQSYYYRINAGYGVPESIGSEALVRILRRRWSPPTVRTSRVRHGLIES